ncbi:hypothetical protein LZ32DRAFT_611659 [Colletotrichum eremochloae]|nr:hypothetical protein LZ32DRAFT_611659 [Colletotrichum eremochloae]
MMTGIAKSKRSAGYTRLCCGVVAQVCIQGNGGMSNLALVEAITTFRASSMGLCCNAFCV